MYSIDARTRTVIVQSWYCGLQTFTQLEGDDHNYIALLHIVHPRVDLLLVHRIARNVRVILTNAIYVSGYKFLYPVVKVIVIKVIIIQFLRLYYTVGKGSSWYKIHIAWEILVFYAIYMGTRTRARAIKHSVSCYISIY